MRIEHDPGELPEFGSHGLRGIVQVLRGQTLILIGGPCGATHFMSVDAARELRARLGKALAGIDAQLEREFAPDNTSGDAAV